MKPMVTLHMQFSAVPITAEGVLALNTMWPQLEPMVIAVAKRLTKDPAIFEEMVEKAMDKLWDLDITRYNLMHPRHDWYVRQSLRNRVVDVWRRHHPEETVTVEEAVGPEMMRAIRLDQRAAS